MEQADRIWRQDLLDYVPIVLGTIAGLSVAFTTHDFLFGVVVLVMACLVTMTIIGVGRGDFFTDQ